jgi:hypothetical protein
MFMTRAHSAKAQLRGQNVSLGFSSSSEKPRLTFCPRSWALALCALVMNIYGLRALSALNTRAHSAKAQLRGQNVSLGFSSSSEEVEAYIQDEAYAAACHPSYAPAQWQTALILYIGFDFLA